MGHSFWNIHVHAIFTTKDRKPLILPSFQARLYDYIGGIIRQEVGQPVHIGGTDNHLHVLFDLRGDVSLSQAMRQVKSLSSGWVHGNFSDGGDFAWQSGYAAFSVTQSSVASVRRYIDKQAEHHAKVTFEEDLTAFFERHGVKYDPTHLWD